MMPTLDALVPGAAMTPSVAGTATTCTLMVNALGSGSLPQQRIGNQMKCTSLTFNIHVDGTSGGTESQNLVRVMVFRVKGWNRSATLDMTRVLQTSAAYYSVQGNYSYNTRQDYRVLYDKQFNLYAYNNAAGATPFCTNIRKTVKLGFKTQYYGSTGNASDLDENALFLAVFSDNSVGPGPTFYGTARLKFRDC